MGKTLAHVHTIYVSALNGEPGFSRKLMEALHDLGCFEFIEDREHADAFLEAYGGDSDTGFVADLTLRDPRGAVVWEAHTMRLHGMPGPMAYERVVAQIRAALPAVEQSRAT